MRTKALILSVALTAAGVATSMAQVYSVNAVGYVNQTIPSGYSMVANPFVTPTNTLDALLPPASLPNFFTLYKYGPLQGGGVGYTIATVDDVDGWVSAGQIVGGTMTIDFGDGVFLFNPTAPLTITWVGEVAQGTPVSNPLVQGYAIKSSKIPQQGKITTDLGYPALNFDTLYKFDTASQSYFIYVFDDVDGWIRLGNIEEPVLGIAESAFLLRSAPGVWNRNFTVN